MRYDLLQDSPPGRPIIQCLAPCFPGRGVATLSISVQACCESCPAILEEHMDHSSAPHRHYIIVQGWPCCTRLVRQSLCHADSTCVNYEPVLSHSYKHTLKIRPGHFVFRPKGVVRPRT